MLPCRIRDYRILCIQKNENALLAFNKISIKYIHIFIYKEHGYMVLYPPPCFPSPHKHIPLIVINGMT